LDIPFHDGGDGIAIMGVLFSVVASVHSGNDNHLDDWLAGLGGVTQWGIPLVLPPSTDRVELTSSS
jgi:hypothetical protein